MTRGDESQRMSLTKNGRPWWWCNATERKKKRDLRYLRLVFWVPRSISCSNCCPSGGDYIDRKRYHYRRNLVSSSVTRQSSWPCTGTIQRTGPRSSFVCLFVRTNHAAPTKHLLSRHLPFYEKIREMFLKVTELLPWHLFTFLDETSEKLDCCAYFFPHIFSSIVRFVSLHRVTQERCGKGAFAWAKIERQSGEVWVSCNKRRKSESLDLWRIGGCEGRSPVMVNKEIGSKSTQPVRDVAFVFPVGRESFSPTKNARVSVRTCCK